MKIIEEKLDPLCICGHLKSHHDFQYVTIDGHLAYQSSICKHIKCKCKHFRLPPKEQEQEQEQEEKENE